MSVPIDDPAVSGFLFHPRPEGPEPPGSALPIETDSEEAVVCGYLHANPGSETLMLFFHGNGEIAADYNALAHLYTNCGVPCFSEIRSLLNSTRSENR